MMDALELLKKDWKKQENSLPHIKVDVLDTMIHKRSSSLTKWILIIALFEFAFWITLTIFTSTKDSFEMLRRLHFYKLNIVINAINFSVLLFFIYRFYKNYKSIQTSESTRSLMQKILRVRRTVNYYVIYNLSMMFVSTILIMGAMYMYDPMVKEVLEISESGKGNLTTWSLLFISAGIVIGILVIFWLFYKLLYGILMRRLRKNYKELNKLEFND